MHANTQNRIDGLLTSIKHIIGWDDTTCMMASLKEQFEEQHPSVTIHWDPWGGPLTANGINVKELGEIVRWLGRHGWRITERAPSEDSFPSLTLSKNKQSFTFLSYPGGSCRQVPAGVKDIQVPQFRLVCDDLPVGDEIDQEISRAESSVDDPSGSPPSGEPTQEQGEQ